MSLELGKCSNPSCHADYKVAGYDEVLLHIRYGTGEEERRVVSLCKRCKAKLTMTMAEAVMLDVIPAEVARLQESITTPEATKALQTQKYSNYVILAIGRDIDELKRNTSL